MFLIDKIQVRPHTVTVRVKQRPAGPPEPVTNLSTRCSSFFHTWPTLAASSSFILTNHWLCPKLFPTWNSIVSLPAGILSTILLPSTPWTKVKNKLLHCCCSLCTICQLTLPLLVELSLLGKSWPQGHGFLVNFGAQGLPVPEVKGANVRKQFLQIKTKQNFTTAWFSVAVDFPHGFSSGTWAMSKRPLNFTNTTKMMALRT